MVQMGDTICCCRCGGHQIDLFKLKDDIWKNASFQPKEIICVGCVEKALRRRLILSDLDSSFPWWNTERPKYYQGILDGIRQAVFETDSEYFDCILIFVD